MVVLFLTLAWSCFPRKGACQGRSTCLFKGSFFQAQKEAEDSFSFRYHYCVVSGGKPSWIQDACKVGGDWSKMESILTDTILLKCCLSGYICLEFTSVFKEVALLPQSFTVWIQLESPGTVSTFCLHFSLFCLFSLRKFSVIAVEGLLQELWRARILQDKCPYALPSRTDLLCDFQDSCLWLPAIGWHNLGFLSMEIPLFWLFPT